MKKFDWLVCRLSLRIQRDLGWLREEKPDYFCEDYGLMTFDPEKMRKYQRIKKHVQVMNAFRDAGYLVQDEEFTLTK